MRRFAFCSLLVLLALAACQDAREPLSLDEPLQSRVSDEVATDRYVVVLQPGVQDVRGVANGLVSAHGGSLGFVYQHALRGFSAELPAPAAAALARNPLVAYVEPDRLFSISAQELPTGIRRIFADQNANLHIDGADDFRVDVDVAIIDTGIDFEHPDLNVVGGVNCTSKWLFKPVECTPGGDDDHYHGTHVAGTVGALDNGIGAVGVAPGARLWAVKVLNSRGSGYTSWIVAGIDWVAAQAATIEVANMSLGGAGFSQAEYDAIQGAVKEGVAFAVAAGNEDDDASNYSPGGFDNVLSVSALADFDGAPGGLGSPTCRSDEDDTLANFSNWGPAVDIAAPGVCILSTFPLEQGGYGTISGTSMASPHVAGALALLASVNKPTNATDVYRLYEQVENAGNDEWTDDSGDGIPEPLLDVSSFSAKLIPVGGGGDPPPPENQAPTASFTFDCTDLVCSFDGTGSSDPDSDPLSFLWSFGDENSSDNSSEDSRPIHTFSAAGDYDVTLTVSDGFLSDVFSETVTVPTSEPPASSDIHLDVSLRPAGRNTFADLVWSGASSTNVDIRRNEEVIATVPNSGSYSEKLKKTGSYTYQVCEAATATCSNPVTVSF